MFGRSLGQALDRMGLRRLVALGATLAYRPLTRGRQRFSVDDDGHWINRDSDTVIVSPTVHTKRHSAYRELVLDHWAWSYRPQAGDTVIDVGAGVGEEAVVFSKLVGETGMVVSIEAHPETFACLEETVRRSRLANVTALNFAVADMDGMVAIGDRADHLANSIIDGFGGLQVRSRPLDDIAEELGLQDVALLKMNIEGAERLAVRGMDRLAERVRNLVISCHDFISDEGGLADFRTFNEVRARLEDLGFDTLHRPDHPRPWARYYLYGRNRKQQVRALIDRGVPDH